MTATDLGGESPCYAHLLEPPPTDLETRGDIERVVGDFYRQAAIDDVLGPVFAAAHVDWPSHIATLTDFWAWQLLGERGYDGNPLRAHEPAHHRTPFTDEHYARWLDLFETTVDDHFAGPHADLAKARARRMARALQRLLDGVSASGDAPVEVLVTREGRTVGQRTDRDRAGQSPRDRS